MSPGLNRLIVVWAIWGPVVSALLTYFLLSRTYTLVWVLIILSGVIILLPLIWDWFIFQINRTPPGKAVLARVHPRAKVAAEVATYLNRGIRAKKGSFLGFGLRRVGIVWTKRPEKIREISSEDTIIYLEPSLNNEEGLFMALEEYVEIMFMSVARVACSKDTANAIKIALMESFGEEFLLRTTRMKDLYAEFIRELIPTDGEKGANFESFLQVLRNITKGGMFESIFMYLLKFVSDKLTLQTISSPVKEEALVGFAKFLETISLKERGEDVPLDFDQYEKLFKVHIILITRPEASSLRPHLDHLVRYSRQGYNPIFVSGMGKNTELVEEFVKKARKLQENHELYPFDAFKAKGRAVKGGESYKTCTYALCFRWGGIG